MTTMDQLAHLATLKRQATSLPGLHQYRDALYAATDTLTNPGRLLPTAALILDAIIDRIAHEELSEAAGADLSDFQPTNAPEPHQAAPDAHSDDWDVYHTHRHHAHE